jgi:hypothetical protein
MREETNQARKSGTPAGANHPEEHNQITSLIRNTPHYGHVILGAVVVLSDPTSGGLAPMQVDTLSTLIEQIYPSSVFYRFHNCNY